MVFDCLGWEHTDFGARIDADSARQVICAYRCGLAKVYLAVFDRFVDDKSVVAFEKKGMVNGFSFTEEVILGFARENSALALSVSGGCVVSPSGRTEKKASFDFVVVDDCDMRATLRFNKFDYDVLLEFMGFSQDCALKALVGRIYEDVLQRI